MKAKTKKYTIREAYTELCLLLTGLTMIILIVVKEF